MIAIMDYGVGNLFSLKSSLAQLGQDTVVTADPDTIRKADRLILPGVGAFGDAMDKLVATGLVPVIRAAPNAFSRKGSLRQAASDDRKRGTRKTCILFAATMLY